MIQPPKGDTYTEFPDGFEATASTRSISRSIVLSIWLIGFTGAFIAGMMTDPDHVPTVAKVAVAVALAAVIPNLAMSIAGRVRLTLQGNTLRISSGVGGLGSTQNVDWSSVRNVQEVRIPGRSVRYRVLIQGATDVKIGRLLGTDRRTFLVQVLQRELAKRPGTERTPSSGISTA
jgi:hypothetical protein